MYYTVYKVTNNLNGKFYIGAHKTVNIEDGYMGSGKVLKYAQAKHGITNFTKDILFVYDTPEQMYAKESELVNTDFITRDDTYNVMVGGYGGFDHVNKLPSTAVTRLKNIKVCNHKFREKLKEPVFALEWSRLQSSKMKSLHQKGVIKYNTFEGRRHTDETKQKMSDSHIGKQDGVKNSQYGTMWITDGVKSVKVKKYYVIPDGWYKGRKMK